MFLVNMSMEDNRMKIERKITNKVVGFRTQDGAGVSLVRVLGNRTTDKYDPILMLDSFDSLNPEDYIAGFPMHPHRGIETISYVYRGGMIHRDSLGNEDAISDGEIQWMTAGSGIMHEERLPASERMLGVQLWLNMPAKDKMASPAYQSVKNHEIEEISFEGGKIRLLAGEYTDENGKVHEGFKGKYLPITYYDVHLNPGACIDILTDPDDSVMAFTLLGKGVVAGEDIAEKTAVKLSQGDVLRLEAKDESAHILFIASKSLNEPIAWGGPIVMNTEEELNEAFRELHAGTFIKGGVDYSEK